ncbi:alpha/beta fold hydrolase [Archangium minus]|uniref:alpha/beta fold hydrolase n=1 Tax=Archangium minus TaxID=83450 RepID=UPI0037BF9811
MTWVGLHHPERIDNLVFLDATDDRAEIAFDGQAFPKWMEAMTGLESTPAEFREKARAYLPTLRRNTDAADATLRQLPGWKLVKLENARHFVWLTNHADVVREMRAFLSP